MYQKFQNQCFFIFLIALKWSETIWQVSHLISLSFWRIISSNRSHIVKLPLSRVRNRSGRLSPAVLCNTHGSHAVPVVFLPLLTTSPRQQLKFMHTSHQFLLLSSPPAKEARFRTAKKLYGSTFAFQWVTALLPPRHCLLLSLTNVFFSSNWHK